MREKMCKERRGSDWVKSSDELRRDGDTIRANCDELYVKISRVGSKKEQRKSIRGKRGRKPEDTCSLSLCLPASLLLHLLFSLRLNIFPQQ